ncbi:hypothetical protein PHYSODRAFT_508167 [Phytophthora sojae]|uniref:FLZ-type domain-containing protein n=1 Tax=Phytophthora sojae (strain P6497) TaxID=1094619 RepID=G4ZPV2_PHYSP|nr:hypothetical protein PHYSODRAFT_508167 [Phytophthora sojae]EGZ16357.1 hypothetical protein PHYSODRAFT_508167 [Phytophthora sojae]|eukprot:XP_009530106.1 hypothetical protein PHYSODRAFT_508167 [Phytophthora sojae]
MISQPTAAYGGNNKSTTRLDDEPVGRRPSFAALVAKLIFRRGRSSAELRAKSWPGREESVPVTVPGSVAIPTTPARLPSASIVIPNSISSSTPASLLRTRSMRIPKRPRIHTSCSEAAWRHRQAHCANCERLFSKSMSSLVSSAGRFCSLDCKANFEYVSVLQEAMDVEFDSISSGLLGSSMEGDNAN